MAETWISFGTASSYPWRTENAFHFVAPGGTYAPLQWRLAVLSYPTIRDFVALLRHWISDDQMPCYCQEHHDERGEWYPLEITLWALDLEAPHDGLCPLPQPQSIASPNGKVSHAWLIALGDAAAVPQMNAVWVPLGLIATRLLTLATGPWPSSWRFGLPMRCCR